MPVLSKLTTKRLLALLKSKRRQYYKVLHIPDYHYDEIVEKEIRSIEFDMNIIRRELSTREHVVRK